MKRFAQLSGAAASLFLCLALAVPGVSKDAAKPEPKPQDIDVVLCLDVSGSMQGLIDSAKTKLWDIVNELAKAKPAPNLRVGLYSYGHSNYDPAKGWVRKELDLGTDLDALYQKLFALTINGGDEYVGRVCRDAIQDQKWSQAKDSLKLIFVAGNEPATQDPLVSIKDLSQKAIAESILINTIYCGGADDPDAAGWRELAGLAKGRFANINQNQKVAINTPVDKELAKLAEKLNATYVAFGKDKDAKADNQKKQTENAKVVGVSSLAARVQAQNSAYYNCADWCLVDKLKADPKFDITKVPDSELSPEMKKMTPAERVQYVKSKGEERAKLQKEIDQLTVQRNTYIRDESKKLEKSNPAGQAFYESLRQTIKVQAKGKGIHIPD